MTILKSRLIAMFDILGFSTLIADPDRLSAVTEQLSDTISLAKTHALVQRSTGEDRKHDAINFETANFVFDNVVLVSKEVTPENVSRFIGGTVHLMKQFLSQGLPLRGAISLGDYCADSAHGVFLSDRFKRLSAAEAAQEWTGCLVLEEATAAIASAAEDSLTNATKASRVVSYEVPLKSGTAGSRAELCLNWVSGLRSEQIADFLSVLSPAPGKLANTQAFAEYIDQLPDPLHPLPAEFAPAAWVRIEKGPTGMATYGFLDHTKEPCDPGTLHWVHDPRKGDTAEAFIGYATDDELRRLQMERGWS